MQSHLLQTAIHNNLVHQVSGFNVIQFLKVVLVIDTLAVKKLLHAIDVCFKGLSKFFPVDCVTNQINQHRLYGSAVFD